MKTKQTVRGHGRKQGTPAVYGRGRGVHTERIMTVRAAQKIHQARKIRKIHPAGVLVQKGKRLHRKQHQKVHRKWYQRVH